MAASIPSSCTEHLQSPFPPRRKSTPKTRQQQRLIELRQRNRELEGLLYGFIHDLRTYLHIMMIATDVLDESIADLPLDCVTRDVLPRLHGTADRMRDHLHVALRIARLGQNGVVLQAVPLQTLIGECLYDLQVDILTADAKVIVTPPLPMVKAETVFLRIAISNLLSNALKFVAPGERPQVHITAMPSSPGRWQLQVSDNGIGLSRDQQNRLFQPFKRLHDDTIYPGLGLGLSTVRMITEAFGGQVGVDSTPGVGSTFWLDLADALPMRGAKCDEKR